MNKIRLLMVDDHANVLKGLRIRLSHEADIEIVGEATTSAEAIKLARQWQPDVVLIDPMIQDNYGLFAIKQIANQFPNMAIVALSAYVDTLLRMELRRAGVFHVLNKGIASQELIVSLREAVQEKQHHVAETASSLLLRPRMGLMGV